MRYNNKLSLAHRFALIGMVMFMLFSTGCAMLLAPGNGDAPDMSRIQAGQSRTVVEEILGSPITDVRLDPRAGAARRCSYHYFVRHAVAEDESFKTKFVSKLVGFHEEQIHVYYDRNDRVVRVTTPPPARARLSEL